MTRVQAQEFAGKFGQESVAHKDGLVMECGSCIMFDGNGPTFIDSINHNSNHFSALKVACCLPPPDLPPLPLLIFAVSCTGFASVALSRRGADPGATRRARTVTS
eukprot:3599875-Rhodomonas_salina.1